MVTPAVQRARFLAPGDKLGKHDLIRQVAVGGMAELYLARTMGIEGFEKLVVIKRILPQYVGNASFVNMFLNEARLAATLHHPNIAQVYDIGQDAGEYFFSMEYVHGEDLGRVLRTANEGGVPISLDAALTLGSGLCAGLHHAHEKTGPDGRPLNVVHRDVSPSNVLVSYDGAVKLVDFGIARVNSTPGSTAGGLKGKISYMSPEQCRGKTALDRRSDIFSVGTLLYELTTGQLPFTDETEYAVLNHIVNEDAVPPSKLVADYPQALEAIVMRALSRDPDKRYATAIDLQTDLEDFAHDMRLRVSPLVLARLMSSLFPARLEEWANAKAQGAFFVEQHVVRTMIENSQDDVPAFGEIEARDSETLPAVSGEVGPSDDDQTAVTTPPTIVDDRATEVNPVVPPPRPSQPVVRVPASIPPRASAPAIARPSSPSVAPRSSAPAIDAPRSSSPSVAPRSSAPAIDAPRSSSPAIDASRSSSPAIARSSSPAIAAKTQVGVAPPDEAPQRPTPTPIPNTPLPFSLQPSQPGILVSNSAAPATASSAQDLTARVRIPEAKKRSGKLVLALALVGALGAAGITYAVLSRGDDKLVDDKPAKSEVGAKPVTKLGSNPDDKSDPSADNPKSGANTDDKSIANDKSGANTDDKSGANTDDKSIANDKSSAKSDNAHPDDKSSASPDDKSIANDKSGAKSDNAHPDDKSSASPDDKSIANDKSSANPGDKSIASDKSGAKSDDKSIARDKSGAKSDDKSIASDKSGTKPDEIEMDPVKSPVKKPVAVAKKPVAKPAAKPVAKPAAKPVPKQDPPKPEPTKEPQWKAGDSPFLPVRPADKR